MKAMCLWLLTATGLAAQIVEGTVINSTAGVPLAGVRVRLVAGKSVIDGISDAQGAFRIEGVKDGDYTAEFSKKGFRQPDRNAAARRPFHVTAGANPIRLDAKMQALSKLSGRVTGGGKPIRGAEVQLMIAHNFVGQAAKSDENGEFHMEDLEPGTYLLSARAPKESAPPDDKDGRALAWMRTWYPSADRSGAANIVLTAGADLIGEEIQLRAVPAYRVQGRVLSEKGEPVAGATVKAQPTDEIFIGQFEHQARTAADGSFELRTLTEGAWRLVAEMTSGEDKLRVQLAQQIAGRDIAGLEIRMMPPFAVSGKVIRIGPAAAADQRQMGVMLAPREGGDHLLVGMTDGSGAFRIEKVPPGTYRFQPTTPGPGYYLASIQLGAREVLGQYVEIAPGVPVTITYRSDGGTVRGTVEDCGSAAVVLAPQDPNLQYPEFIRRTACQQNGRYEITGLRPGEYYAFAFDTPPGLLESSLRDAELFGFAPPDASFAGQWMNQALRITVRAGEATDASLKVTQRGSF